MPAIDLLEKVGGHASFRIKDAKTGAKFYFVDPWELKQIPQEKADAVFVTHAHYDHFSPEDLKKVAGENSVIVLVNGCENLSVKNKVIKTKPNESFEVAGIKVETVPAYNIKPERLNFHQRANNWVGYVFNVNGFRIYHAGDTDFITEMKLLRDIDLALLPMGGTYTMDVTEAIAAANTIGAKITVPIHYKGKPWPANRDWKAMEEQFKSGVSGMVEFL